MWEFIAGAVLGGGGVGVVAYLYGKRIGQELAAGLSRLEGAGAQVKQNVQAIGKDATKGL